MVLERRQSVLRARSSSRIYVVLAVIVSLVTMVIEATLAVLVPTDAGIRLTILGIATPLITTLIGGGLHGMIVSVDGRVSQLLKMTAEKERAEGTIEGLKANPNIPLK